MNETIYDTGTIAWALQRAREASDIPRNRQKIGYLKQLLSFIGYWCKRGEFDEWQADFCNKKFTKMFNQISTEIGEEKAYSQLILSFLEFYQQLDDLKYPKEIIVPFLDKYDFKEFRFYKDE